MDETGTSVYSDKDKSKFFTRSCVLIPENVSRQVEKSCTELLSVEGSNQLPFNVKRQEPCIFSAKDIYWGHEGWDYWDESRRKKLLCDVINLMVQYKLPIMYGHLNKAIVKDRYTEPENPHMMTFVQCGESVERWMRRNAPDQRWLPCIGTADFGRSELENLYVRCRDTGPPYGHWPSRFCRVADAVSFTGPRISRCFALADLCAFVYNRHEIGRNDWGLYDMLKPLMRYEKRWPRK
jgi:hypothetical protein